MHGKTLSLQKSVTFLNEYYRLGWDLNFTVPLRSVKFVAIGDSATCISWWGVSCKVTDRNVNCIDIIEGLVRLKEVCQCA